MGAAPPTGGAGGGGRAEGTVLGLTSDTSNVFAFRYRTRRASCISIQHCSGVNKSQQQQQTTSFEGARLFGAGHKVCGGLCGVVDKEQRPSRINDRPGFEFRGQEGEKKEKHNGGQVKSPVNDGTGKLMVDGSIVGVISGIDSG